MSVSINRRIKPTSTTPFHIDYDWWSRDQKDLRVYLISLLPSDKQPHFNSQEEGQEMDWIDEDTAEVFRVDALQMALKEAAKSDEFVNQNSSLVDMIFRTFLANGNTPLTPEELGDLTGRTPDMILRTIAGARVYKGIRPDID